MERASAESVHSAGVICKYGKNMGARKPKLKHVDSGQIRYAANGKLYAAMANRTPDTGDAPAPVGLILWREP